jgi:hypothetical protein
MSHIDNGSPRLFVSVFFTYLYVGIFLYYLHMEYKNFAERRKNYFTHGDPRLPVQMQYSVIVENIPPDYRTSTKLKELFEDLFPGEVHSAAMMMSLPQLDDAIEKRDKACAQLEKAIAAKEANKENKDPEMTTVDGEPTCCCRCCLQCCYETEQVDAIQYWRQKLDEMNQVVGELQKQAFRAAEGDPLLHQQKVNQKKRKHKRLRHVSWKSVDTGSSSDKSSPEKPSNGHDDWHVDKDNNEYRIFFGHKNVSKTGMVSFKTRKCQVVACGMPILSGKFPYMRLQAAPTPTDIIWENITVDVNEIQKTRNIVSIILTAGFIFWASVLTFVAAMSSLANMQKILPFLASLDPETKAILSGQLPVFALMIFVSLLPTILTYFVQNIEKRKTTSEVQSEVFVW